MAAATKTKKISTRAIGRTAVEGRNNRAQRSKTYRAAAAEYAAIRELRKKNWIAAHIRERRFELELTQQQVADMANTSHSYISRVERGDHLPTLPILAKILAVLDEEIVITIQERGVPADEAERETAAVPELVAT